MPLGEYLLDRNRELEREGQVMTFRQYGEIGSVSIRRMDDTYRHYALAAFEGKDYQKLGLILNALGYSEGKPFPFEVKDDDIENEVKLEVLTRDQFFNLQEVLKNSLSFKVSERNYLLDRNDELREEGCLLRLRREERSFPEKQSVTLLTYKGPDQDSEFKKKLELEVQINNFHMASQFFKHLGFTVIEDYWKERQVYEFPDFRMFLDRAHKFSLFMPPQRDWRKFVEIEGDDKTIRDAMEVFGLKNLPIINQSYSEIL